MGRVIPFSVKFIELDIIGKGFNMIDDSQKNRIIKCRKCKDMFNINGVLGELCPKCIYEEDSTYQKVRSYVRDRPGVSIDDVADDLDVPKSKIMTYIREERIEVINKHALILNCKNCGKTINTGVFCTECLKFSKTGKH